jgi:exopolysaccharide biosynthesis polyprenyl glycosylphosphotransferase
MSTAVEAIFDRLDSRTLEILEQRKETPTRRRRGWILRRALVLADIFGLVGAFVLAEVIFRHHGPQVDRVDRLVEFSLFFASLPLWLGLAHMWGLYNRDEEHADHSTVDDFVRVFNLVTVVTWLLYGGAFVTGLAAPDVAKLVTFWAAAVPIVVIGRSIGRGLCRRRIEYIQNTLIVGAGDVGQSVARRLLRHPEYGLNVVGFIDSHPRERSDDLEHVAVLGTTEELLSVVQLLDVERVIFAFSSEGDSATLALVQELSDQNVQIDIVPRLFDTFSPKASVHMIEGFPLVGVPPLRLPRTALIVKRALDVTVAAITLLVLFPVLVVVAGAVKIDSPGPLLYRHRRVGRRSTPIDVLKFRTMHSRYCRGDRYGGETAEEEFRRLMEDPIRNRQFETNYKLDDDPRVTRIGRFLRSTSLDELPQLVNVLRGELSLVGPRAITTDELDRYGTNVDFLLESRPGVTGYWQINGRSNLDYDDRVRLDLAYIAGWSFSLDLQILAKTVNVLVRRQGAV